MEKTVLLFQAAPTAPTAVTVSEAMVEDLFPIVSIPSRLCSVNAHSQASSWVLVSPRTCAPLHAYLQRDHCSGRAMMLIPS